MCTLYRYAVTVWFFDRDEREIAKKKAQLEQGMIRVKSTLNLESSKLSEYHFVELNSVQNQMVQMNLNKVKTEKVRNCQN